jgi:hypothetical protein
MCKYLRGHVPKPFPGNIGAEIAKCENVYRTAPYLAFPFTRPHFFIFLYRKVGGGRGNGIENIVGLLKKLLSYKKVETKLLGISGHVRDQKYRRSLCVAIQMDLVAE